MSFDILRSNNQQVRNFIYPTGSNKSRFWCPQRSTLETIVNYLYDPTGLMNTTPPANLWKNIGSVFFGADPQNAILSLRLYPCNFTNVNSTYFKIMGQYIYTSGSNQLLCEEIVANRLAWVYDLGHYTIPYYDNVDSFLSYDPYTKLFLYLPFASLLELDTKRYVGKTLQVNAIIDFYNGDIYYLISTTEDNNNYTFVEQVRAHIAVDVPLYKGFMFDLARNTLQGALKAPLEIANEKIPSVVNDVLKTKFIKNQMMYGNLNGVGSFVSPLKCNVIMYRPKIKYHLNDTNYNHLYGVPCKEIKTLSNVSGYTKVDGVHIKEIVGATDEEIKEIEKILFNGFINNSGTAHLTITYNSSHITWLNDATQIIYGANYVTLAQVESGYQLDNIQVTMGGVDITATAVSENRITIPNVTGNIIITAQTSLIPVTYSVDYSQLIGAVMTNRTTSVEEGSTYDNTFTPDYYSLHYGIKTYFPLVYMGGIQEQLYGNSVSIDSVSSNIVIQGHYPLVQYMNSGNWAVGQGEITPPDEAIDDYTDTIDIYVGNNVYTISSIIIDNQMDYDHNSVFIYGNGNVSQQITNVAFNINQYGQVYYVDRLDVQHNLGNLTKIHFNSSSSWANNIPLLKWVDFNFTKET